MHFLYLLTLHSIFLYSAPSAIYCASSAKIYSINQAFYSCSRFISFQLNGCPCCIRLDPWLLYTVFCKCTLMDNTTALGHQGIFPVHPQKPCGNLCQSRSYPLQNKMLVMYVTLTSGYLTLKTEVLYMFVL